MKIEHDMKLDFNNVLIRPKRSNILSRNDVDLEREFIFPNSTKKWKGVPIIAANMDTIGTFEVYQVLSQHKIITCFHKFYRIEHFKHYLENNVLDKNYYMISTGINDDDFVRLQEIVDYLDCDFICIDIANGYLETLITFCQKVRNRYPDKILVAGNVVSREMVEELIINGKVDIVKCGIGGGSACITRMKTGVGMPQLSCIIECSDAAHGVNGFIIGDGGITNPADMCKAFGGGADFVMCGGIFSGHDENPGDVIEENGQMYKLFYGMSSELAMNKYYGKMEKYRSSEGRVIKVKYRGKLADTILDYLGGLRSCCTYINAKNIKNIPKCTTFLLVSQQLNTSLV
jgi:GMP reductase